MLIACWSVKGGAGTTVVTAGMALSAATGPGSVLLVDLAGDLPACLGVPESSGPGVAEWLAAGPEVPPDALHRMRIPLIGGLHLLPRGEGPLLARRSATLVQLLATSGHTVVVDCGRLDHSQVALGSADARVAAESDRSLLVSRLCFLGLKRAGRAPLRPSGLIVVEEPGRSLRVEDAEATVGAPVVGRVAVDPAVARAVDAGLLASRMPRGFGRATAGLVAA